MFIGNLLSFFSFLLLLLLLSIQLTLQYTGNLLFTFHLCEHFFFTHSRLHAEWTVDSSNYFPVSWIHLTGTKTKLYYIQEGKVNDYALGFQVPVPSNISSLYFNGQNLVASTPVSLLIYSLPLWRETHLFRSSQLVCPNIVHQWCHNIHLYIFKLVSAWREAGKQITRERARERERRKK